MKKIIIKIVVLLVIGLLLLGMLLPLTSCVAPEQAPEFDVVIRGGTVYDGTGSEPVRADVGLRGDQVVTVGDLSKAGAKLVVDASGLAVAPGFVNMLSWSTESLLVDGRSQGELRQGVTTQVMGEGSSMGPLSPEMKLRIVSEQGDVKYPIEWTTLAEYLTYLERRGVSQNVASFVGATTIREHVVGLEDKQPTPEQLEEMRRLVRQEMEAGALGVGSSLIYAPAAYAKTDELIALSKVAAEHGGMYISHMRNEGHDLLKAIDELVEISRKSGAPAEIYHFKQAGKVNWDKLDAAVAKVNAARAEGLRITADMYT